MKDLNKIKVNSYRRRYKELLLGNLGVVMFVMEIKLNNNPENKPNLKHTTKPQNYNDYKMRQGYWSLPTVFNFF